MMTCHFLPTTLLTELTLFIMSITDGITNGQFRQYFPESSGTVHSPIVLLIIDF
jgi:hypothetical protein